MTKTQLIDALMKEVKVVDKDRRPDQEGSEGVSRRPDVPRREDPERRATICPCRGSASSRFKSQGPDRPESQTGAEIKIAAKKVVKFTVAKNLKDTVLKKAPAKKSSRTPAGSFLDGLRLYGPCPDRQCLDGQCLTAGASRDSPGEVNAS